MKFDMGRVIKTLLKEHGWTVTNMAEAIGMKQAEFSRRLHSDASFSIFQIYAICAKLGITIDELFRKAMAA